MVVEKMAFPCFYIFAFYSLTVRQTDKNYRIDAYIYEECLEKKLVVCFN